MDLLGSKARGESASIGKLVMLGDQKLNFFRTEGKIFGQSRALFGVRPNVLLITTAFLQILQTTREQKIELHFIQSIIQTHVMQKRRQRDQTQILWRFGWIHLVQNITRHVHDRSAVIGKTKVFNFAKALNQMIEFLVL